MAAANIRRPPRRPTGGAYRHMVRLFLHPGLDPAGAPIATYLAAIHPDGQARVSAEVERAMVSGAPHESVGLARRA